MAVSYKGQKFPDELLHVYNIVKNPTHSYKFMKENIFKQTRYKSLCNGSMMNVAIDQLVSGNLTDYILLKLLQGEDKFVNES